MKTSKKIMWGLYFICAAAVIIFYAVGDLGDIPWFKLVITLLMIPIFISGFFHLSFFEILIPPAIVYTLFMGFPPAWAVIVAAVLLSIGLSIIFKKKNHFSHHHVKNTDFEEVVENVDETVVSFEESFGASSKYINSENLKKAKFKCSFGALKIYFDNATLDPEGAEVFFDCKCCGIEIYIPKEWRIINNMQVTLAGVEEKYRYQPGNGPILTLSGNIKLSGIEIIYI